jgi:hypothetical protein
MATIDPNIAMGYKPIQIENPLNQLAAYSQIQGAQQGQQLNALKMRQAQQDFDTQNALAEAYKGAFNPSTGSLDYNLLTKQLAERGAGTAIPGVIEAQKKAALTEQQLKTQQATEQKTLTETTGLQYKQKLDKANKALADISALDTPQEALAGIDRHLASGDIDQAKADMLRNSITTAPNFRAWQKSTLVNILDAKDRLVTEETARANLAREQNAKRQTDISGGQLNLAERRLAADLDPTVQAKLAASKAAGTTAGKAQAAAAIALPNAIATSESLLSKIDAMVGTPAVKDKSGKVINAGTAPHPGFTGAVGMGRLQTLGIPGVEQLIPGTPAADFKARFDEIMGGAFLEAFETLKGGGAITETEGKKATAAKTRMSLAQSEKEFLAAANEYKAIVKTGIERARKKAGEAPSGGVDYDALVNKYTQ